MQPAIYLITGLMASGKSTVGQCLAEKLTKAVHLRGDIFRRMIVSGREDMRENPPKEALEQLYLRYQLTADAAKTYFDHGFTVVMQDNYYGSALMHMIEFMEGYPLRVVVLCPDAKTIQTREKNRGKTGYAGFDIVPLYAAFMEETPRKGLWIDNSQQTAEETADCILRQVNWE
ncbi:MAG: phosphotransferase [Clostridiales bacterium]|nr:phosphotransferase [Clostridiales bacterium]